MSTETVSFKAPEDMVRTIEQAVEDGNYTSKGEFLRDLIRNIEHRKLTDQARDDIKEARQQDSQSIDDL